MGYTHFDSLSVKDGGAIAIGSVGSETVIIDSAGGITATSDIKTSLGTTLDGAVYLAVAITADATVQYIAAPIAGNVTGWVSYGVSAGTGRATAVSTGSAGANLCATGAVAASGTVGAVVAMVASSGGNTVTKGQVLSVAMGSCATTQALNHAVLQFTPTA